MSFIQLGKPPEPQRGGFQDAVNMPVSAAAET